MDRPIGDDLLARSQARAEQGHVVFGLGDGDRPRLDRAVLLHHIGEAAVWPGLQRRRRYGHAVGHGLDDEVRIDELAGPQGLVGIREFRFELDRAGRLVDLIVDEIEDALRNLLLVGGVIGQDLELALPHGAPTRGMSASGNGKDDVDRLDLRDHDQRFAVRLDEIAKIDLPDAGDPVDGRADRGVFTLSLAASMTALSLLMIASSAATVACCVATCCSGALLCLSSSV